MKWSTKLNKWLRILHRDLGYLLVGITVIYGVSGYLLNHMDGKDPAYETTEATIRLPQHLNQEALYIELLTQDALPNIKRILMGKDEFNRVMFNGGIGVYNSQTGEFSYELHRKKPLIYAINKLHYNKVKGWTIMGDVFAFSLIFLALSGMLLVKGKNGFRRRGVWLVMVGLAIPIIYLIIT